MQLLNIFLIATTVASAAAAPTGGSSSQSAAPIKLQHDGNKWKPGWEGAPDKDKYICNTTGLVNILNCDNILDGDTVNVDLGSLLGGLGSLLSGLESLLSGLGL